MSYNYAGNSASYPTAVQIADDGDQPRNSQLAPGVEGALDRTAWLARHMFGGEAGDYFPVPLTPLMNDNARFVWAATGVGLGLLQVDVTDEGFLLFELPLITKLGGIVSLTAHLVGQTGRAGLPATKPQISLVRENNIDAATAYTIVATQVDGSGTLGAYEGAHYISLAISPTEAIDFAAGGYAKRYYVLFKGEAGANAMANKLLLKGLTCDLE